MVQIAVMNPWLPDVTASLHWSYTICAVVGIALLSSGWSAHAASAYVSNVESGRGSMSSVAPDSHTPKSHTRLNKLSLGRDELRGIDDQTEVESTVGQP